MSTLQDNDLFIVDRNGTNYQLPHNQMSTLQDTDLFIVEREGVNYQVPASDVNTGGSGSLDSPVQVLTPLNGAGVSELTKAPMSSVITDVDSTGGTYVPETSQIVNVDVQSLDAQWSKYVSQTTAGPVPQADAYPAFDGNVETRWLGDSGDGCIFAPETPLPITNTLEYVLTAGSTLGYTIVMVLDGIEAESAAAEYEYEWYTFTEFAGKTISTNTPLTIYWKRPNGTYANACFNTMKIDGRMVVDAGVPGSLVENLLTFSNTQDFSYFSVGTQVQNNASVVDINPAGPSIKVKGGQWAGSDGSGTEILSTAFISNAVTTANNGVWGSPKNMLDQDITNYSQANKDKGNVTVTQTFPSPIRCSNNIFVYAALTGRGDNGTISINGLPAVPMIRSAANDPSYTEFTPIEFTGEVESIVLQRGGDTGTELFIFGYAIDGKRLVDSTDPSEIPPSTVIGSAVTYDQILTFADETDLDVMVGPITQVDENGDTKVPVTSSIASIAAGSTTISGTEGAWNGYAGPAWPSNTTWDGLPTGQALGTDEGGVGISDTGADIIGSGTPTYGAGSRGSEGWAINLGGVYTVQLKSAGNTYYVCQTTAQTKGSGAEFTGDDVTVTGHVIWFDNPGVPAKFSSIEITVIPSETLSFDAPNPELKYFSPGTELTPNLVGATHTSNVSNPLVIINWNTLDNLVAGGDITDYSAPGPLMPQVDGGVLHNMNQFKTDSPVSSAGFGYFTGASFISLAVPVKGYVSDDGDVWTEVVSSDSLPITIGDGTPHQYFCVTGAMGSWGDMSLGGDYYSWLIPPSPTVTAVDVSANTMTVNGGSYSVGDTVTGPPLIATANNVIAAAGNTLSLLDITGDFYAGLYVKGAATTPDAPSPTLVEFTSMNGGTTKVTGTDASLAYRTWQLQTANAVTGPWTDVVIADDYAASPSQDGGTPWSGKPLLQPDTYYQVKVTYNSTNAESVESTYNTFKTGANS